MRRTVRVIGTVALAMLATVVIGLLAFMTSIANGVAQAAGTILIMGGNDNPNGDNMELILNERFNPASPNFAYPAGVVLVKVPWASNIGQNGYEPSQTDGVQKIDTAIGDTLAAKPGEQIYVVGYSSSANVMVRELRLLNSRGNKDAEGNPVPINTEFYAIGNPNRPNGGIFNRLGFAASFLGPLSGYTFDGANPDTDYVLRDVSWRYDPISDFPTYPLNFVATANSLIGFFTLHSNYGPADLDTADVRTDLATGNIYYTLTPNRLPLLAPLQMIGVPAALLDIIQPGLTAVVEAGYDRTRNPWDVTPAQIAPGVPIPGVPVPPPTPAPAAEPEPSLLASKAVVGSEPPPVTVGESLPETKPAEIAPVGKPVEKPVLTVVKPKQSLIRDSLKAVVGTLGLLGTPSKAPTATATPGPSTVPTPVSAPTAVPSAAPTVKATPAPEKSTPGTGTVPAPGTTTDDGKDAKDTKDAA